MANHLDKVDIPAKWIVVPKVVTGKQLDPGSAAMEDLDWLVALRNKLVHFKSKTKSVDEIQVSDFLWYEDAARAVRTVTRAAAALKEVEPDADTDWLRSE